MKPEEIANLILEGHLKKKTIIVDISELSVRFTT